MNEIVLIDFDEDIALNISAEEYENLFPDSADNEVAGIDNEVAVVDNEEAGAENEEAGAENEETGAMRPKTPTGRESKLSIWKYMTLLPTGRIKCNICKKAFKYNNSTTSHMTHLKRKHLTMVDFSDSSQSVGSLGLGNSDSQPSVVISKRRQKNITRALTRIITVDIRPPHMMKGLGFLSAMKEKGLSYVVSHPTTFTRTYILEAYQ